MNLIKSMLIKQLDMFINSIINSTETVFSCKTHLLLMSTWGSKKKKESEFRLRFDWTHLYIVQVLFSLETWLSSEFNHKFVITYV